MLPTHGLVGMAAALPFALAVPELAGVALTAGFVGGLLPDLDLYAGHRRTLHFPVYLPAAATPALGAAVLAPSVATVSAAFLLLGAALHSAMDVLGGGLELYPWAATSDRAVYDHFRGRWLAPRRVVPYDGSVEDLLLAGALAVPLFVLAGPALRPLVIGAAGIAAAYAVVRRRLPAIAEWLVDAVLTDRLPERAVEYVPARYRARSPAPAADRSH